MNAPRTASRIALALSLSACPAIASAQSAYYARSTVAPRTASSAPAAPARRISCSSARSGYSAGDNSRRFVGNHAPLALALQACEAQGSPSDRTCSAGKLDKANANGPAGSYNTFLQEAAAIATVSPGWTAWTCSPL